MSFTLYYHPLASFCHKVLIGLYEKGTIFRAEIVDLADQTSSAQFLSFWPVGKIPVLRDEQRGRTVPETSIIIEYLEQHQPDAPPLLPANAESALEVRLWDRFFDLYVQVPMQKIVVDRLRPAGQADVLGVDEARLNLRKAYALAERQLEGRTWAASDAFSLADCAAAPALFYANIVEPFSASHPNLALYFERLLARPSVARTLREARPYFSMFPLQGAIPARFLEGAA
ncbi:MAG TPA: glutathione S-transferase family protein [Polyangiaceae bacterium]|nr:glutathione S-transferase family protein [Polyangiaceae bacterium]